MKKNILLTLLILSLAGHKLFSQAAGIGITSPHPSAILDVQSQLKGMKIPTLTTNQMLRMPAPLADGLLIYNSSYHQVMQYTGGIWRSLLNSDFWSKPSSTRSYITTNDSISIGNTLATEPLDVNGKIKARENFSAGSALIGTGNLVNTGNGSFQNDISTNGAINLKNAGSLLAFRYNSSDRAFAQLSGDDLRLGLFSDNSNGKVYFNTGGADRMALHNNGHVTIGTSSAQDAILFVNGKLNVIGDITSSSASGIIETSNINEATTGAGNNLICLCYGHYQPTYPGTVATDNSGNGGGFQFLCPGITANSTIIVTPDRRDITLRDNFTINARYLSEGKFTVKIFSTFVYQHAPPVSRESVEGITGFSYVVYK